jgi:FtsZ-binding cell division protein ZapB
MTVEQVKLTPADFLRKARKNESDRKRSAVYKAVDTMRRHGTPITFSAVANAAKVSRWLVYAEGVREYIESARKQQLSEPSPAERAGKIASDISMRTDLELCKQDNRALRAEVTRLKGLLRQQLGHDLEAENSHTLKLRVDELNEANRRYSTDNSRLQHDLESEKEKAAALGNDLVAARSRLRAMMRNRNAD